MKIRSFLLFVVLFCSFSSVYSQIKVSATLEKQKIRIGEQIKLSLELTQPQGAMVIFPRGIVGDTIATKVELVSNSKIDSSTTANNLLLKQTWLITSFDSGSYVIPSLKFLYKNGNRTDTITTNPLTIDVTNNLDVTKLDTTRIDKETGLIDIKNIKDKPFSFKEFFNEYYLYFLIPLLLAGAVVLGIYIYKKRKANQPIIDIKPKEPIHVIALRQLDDLKNKKLWQQNLLKPYYSELSEIVRIYIENRYSISAMEKTSDEVLQVFERSALLDMSSKELLRRMFTLSDFVKFAKVVPTPTENETVLEHAYQFIQNTKLELKEATTND